MITSFRSLFAPPRHLILLVVAFWLGLALAEKRVDRHGLSKERLNNIAFFGMLGYIIGGRMLFVLANLSAFIKSPLSILSIDIDQFDPAGALATVILVGIIYCRHQQLSLWSMLDALTPLFATLVIGLSLSHLAAGTAFGSPTSMPWGMDMWNATRHPTQIYEFFMSLLIFGFLWFRKTDSQAGADFLSFVAFTAGGRLFLEAFRGDSTLIFNGLRLAQVLAWIVLAAAWVTYEFLVRKEIPK
jgi:phosphatidylglycerol:prolipoprotein diacylglycerol transferase